MEDNTQETNVNETEVQTEREPAELSIREALKQKLENTSVKEESDDSGNEAAEPAEQPAVSEQTQPEQPVVPMAPPADMNAAEKEAFLNPTPSNAHILQSYLNRRAYETRSDYSRKMAEVEQLKRQSAGLYETIKQYEDEYAKDGISIGDVARRSIAWDKAMQTNPVQTAIDWLDSYGVRLEDLANYSQQQPQQAPQYLTREEAERIAEERYQSIQSEQQKKAIEYYNQQVVNSFVGSKPLFRDPETAAQLEAEMAPVVQALNATGRYTSPEQVLETAYNYVVNGNPTWLRRKRFSQNSRKKFTG
jgi:hypothetical protein